VTPSHAGLLRMLGQRPIAMKGGLSIG
jgi:hypothetical protein